MAEPIFPAHRREDGTRCKNCNDQPRCHGAMLRKIDAAVNAHPGGWSDRFEMIVRSNPLAAAKPEGTRSVVAIASHPLHATTVHFPIAYVFAGLGADAAFWWTGDPFWARAALWAIGAAFFIGCAAALFGMLEFLLVKEIRRFVASWGHFLAGVTLVAIAAANWWGRVADPEAGALPWGLFLSAVSAAAVGWAGILGGKLVYEHNVATRQEKEKE